MHVDKRIIKGMAGVSSALTDPSLLCYACLASLIAGGLRAPPQGQRMDP